MTVAQTEKLLQMLRTYGVTYFKSEDFEVRMGPMESLPLQPTAGPVAAAVPRGTRPVEAQKPVATIKEEPKVLGDLPPKDFKIPHQLTQVVSLLKMNDEQLVDTLFPEGAMPPQQAVE